MDKKKIVFIIVTVVSVVASVIACALGIPYTPVEVDYTYIGGEECAAREEAEQATSHAAELSSAVFAETGT